LDVDAEQRVCCVATGGVSVRDPRQSKSQGREEDADVRARYTGPGHGVRILSPGRLISSGNLWLENACLHIMQCDCIGRYPPSLVTYIASLRIDFALTGLVMRGSRVCCISKIGVADC